MEAQAQLSFFHAFCFFLLFAISTECSFGFLRPLVGVLRRMAPLFPAGSAGNFPPNAKPFAAVEGHQ